MAYLVELRNQSKLDQMIDNMIIRITFTVFPEGDKKLRYTVRAKEGANLLDTLNDMNIKDLSVFGICEK